MEVYIGPTLKPPDPYIIYKFLFKIQIMRNLQRHMVLRSEKLGKKGA